MPVLFIVTASTAIAVMPSQDVLGTSRDNAKPVYKVLCEQLLPAGQKCKGVRILMTYPIHAGPIRIKAVPPKAEAARKTMNEARLGANAVAKLSTKNMADEDKATFSLR